MNKSDILAKLEYFNMVHGVTLRAVSVLSDPDLDYRPQANMRTPRTVQTLKIRRMHRSSTPSQP